MRLPDGREVSRSFVRKTDARAWLESERSKLRRGDWIDPRHGSQTVSDLVWEVHATKVQISARSRELYETIIRNQIDPYLGGWRINRLTTDRVQDWVVELVDRGLAPSTVVRAHMLLSNALRWAVKRRRIPFNAADSDDINLPRPQRSDHRYLTTEDFELAGAVPERARGFVYLGAMGGLRPGEALAMRWDNINLNTGLMRVSGTMQETGEITGPKTDTSRRQVELPAMAVDFFRARRGRSESAFIVEGVRGGSYTLQNFRHQVWNPAVDASVGRPLRPHDLRHTHVALMIAAGAHSKAIQVRLGHRDIRMTLNTYGHLMPGLDKEAASRLNDLFAAQTRPKPDSGVVVERTFGTEKPL